MRRARLHALFALLGVVCFIVATTGFDVIARMGVAGEPLRTAVTQSLHYMFTQPIGTLMLLAPFIGATVLSAEVAKTSNMAIAWIFFGLVAGVLGSLYFFGHWGAQVALEQRQWTAAALSVGMLPFLSIPVLLVAAVGAGVIAWKFPHREP
jgi:hypothetical protein